jgi:hypothetical protein
MSDPRNVAHAKKVTQEKKHHAGDPVPDDAPVVQPGKKPGAAKKKSGPSISEAGSGDAAAPGASMPAETAAAPPSAALEASLVVLTKLKELEFHSRTSLERLAELALTVEDELKQKEFVAPLAEVYAAQSAFQTKLTSLLEAYKAECDRGQGVSA